MTIFHRSLVAGLLLGAIVGCEPGPPKVTPGPETPHGGSLFPLPDSQGYVEILKQAVPGKKPQLKIVAYFLGSDRKSLTSPPTTASLKLSDGGSPIELKPTGETDPAKTGGLASSPFPDRSDLEGDLSATVDGKSVVVSINLR